MNCAGNRNTDASGDRKGRCAMHPDAVADTQAQIDSLVPFKNHYEARIKSQ